MHVMQEFLAFFVPGYICFGLRCWHSQFCVPWALYVPFPANLKQLLPLR